MSLLDVQEQARVAAAIAAVERRTDAELVTVLARRADRYWFIPTLWAALLALLTPALLALTPLWLSGRDLLTVQWLVFVVLAIALHLPAVAPRLIPRAIGHHRAALLARAQFLANGLHHTEAASGLLIFVSEAERYVEILADRGISGRVPEGTWQVIVDTFTARIKAGEVCDGFIECIESCGRILEDQLPLTRDKNELPDHLVILP